MLIAASILVLAAGIPLFLLSSQTETRFAWTIKPAVTAAFLGAGYWGSFVLEFLAARERVWARARVAVVPVLTFTVRRCVATLVHLDRFHFHSSSTAAQISTWGWLAVYALVPPVMTVLLVRQIRAPGVDPPRDAPLPPALRVVLVVQAGVMLAVGALLYVGAGLDEGALAVGADAADRAPVAAWLLGIGLTAAWVVWENDWRRVRVAMIGYAAIGVLQLVVLARYTDELDWSDVQAYVFLLFVLSMPLIGIYGWRAGSERRSASPI